MWEKKPPGRPEKLSKKEQKLIVAKSGKDPKTTLERVRVLQKSFSTSKTVSRCTIRRILKKYLIVSRKAAKKFNLNKNKKERPDQKTLVLENVEEAHWFLCSFNFPLKMEEVLEFFERNII